MPEKNKHSRLRPWSQTNYRIEVAGMLEERWSNGFAGLTITSRKCLKQSVITCLTGSVMDQSQLTGIIDALAELHLPILSVEHLGPNEN